MLKLLKLLDFKGVLGFENKSLKIIPLYDEIRVFVTMKVAKFELLIACSKQDRQLTFSTVLHKSCDALKMCVNPCSVVYSRLLTWLLMEITLHG